MLSSKATQLHDATKNQNTNFRRVIYLGICFMVLFTAYCSAQNLAGQIYTQLGYGNLGQVCIFVIYAFSSALSPVATHFQTKIPAKTGLILGAAPYAGSIFAGALTSFCARIASEEGLCQRSFIYNLNIICAALLGIGGAFLWIFQGIYVNRCAGENVKGIFNGTFFSIFQTSQIWSGAITALILGRIDQFASYIILSLFALLSVIMFFFIGKPQESAIYELAESDEPSQLTEPAESSEITEPTKPAESFELTQPFKTPELYKETLTEALANFMRTLKDNTYHYFFVGLFFSGMDIGCYISFLGNIVATIVESYDNNTINTSIGYVFLVLAIGEVTAGFSMGKLADRFDKQRLFIVTMVINEIALVTTILACTLKSYNLVLLAALLWGYGDNGIQTMISAMIGSVFGGKLELFSAYGFLQSFGLGLSCTLGVIIPKETPLMYLITVTVALITLHIAFIRMSPKH